MHYLLQEGKQLKNTPQRRLVREARSGVGFDLVISLLAGDGGFYRVGDHSEWERQAQEEGKQAKQAGRLTVWQRKVLTVLEDAEGEWLTRRQVCEALDLPWEDRGRNKDARAVEEALRRLVELVLVEGERAGTESTYRVLSSHIPKNDRTTRTTRTTSEANGCEPSGENPDNPDNPDKVLYQAELSGLSGEPPDTENAVPDSLAGLSGLSEAGGEGAPPETSPPPHPPGPPEWLGPLWEVADLFPDAAVTDLVARLWEGFDFRVTAEEATAWLGRGRPSAAEPPPDPWL